MSDFSPDRKQPSVTSAPKIRQLYWCDFQKDAIHPEFWKRRPVIVLSKQHTLFGAATVIPCTTSPQNGNKWAVKMLTTIDGRDSWAVCDKFTSVSVSRLVPDKFGIKRLGEEEFHTILEVVLRWLPALP